MTHSITFFVPGIPAPGGSKKGFGFRRANGSIGVNMVDDAKRNGDWRAVVAHEAAIAMSGLPIFSGPLRRDIDFFLLRPKGHYGSGGNASSLKRSSPRYPTTKPDVDKLTRSTADAMTGIVYVDDALVVEGEPRRRYAEAGHPAGARITITPLDNSLPSEATARMETAGLFTGSAA